MSSLSRVLLILLLASCCPSEAEKERQHKISQIAFNKCMSFGMYLNCKNGCSFTAKRFEKMAYNCRLKGKDDERNAQYLCEGVVR